MNFNDFYLYFVWEKRFEKVWPRPFHLVDLIFIKILCFYFLFSIYINDLVPMNWNNSLTPMLSLDDVSK